MTAIDCLCRGSAHWVDPAPSRVRSSLKGPGESLSASDPSRGEGIDHEGTRGWHSRQRLRRC
jgi:hypothetical protein